MRKIKNVLFRIPKPLRAFVGILMIGILVYLIYVSIGFPAPSFDHEFRRVEQMNMVGPSTIVSRIDSNDYLDFSNLIVGETDDGVIFFSRLELNSSNGGNRYSYAYYYKEKTEDLTVLAAPLPFGFMMGNKLPVYVFDDYPEAVYAELTVKINGINSTTEDGVSKESKFSKTFFATDDRSVDGHFFFCLEAEVSDTYVTEQNALNLLSQVCSNSIFLKKEVLAATDITATVKLYDENRCLVVEKALTITATNENQN